MGNASLLGCPTEVHVSILGYGLKKRDIMSLSRANRRLHSLCQHLLYKDIEIADVNKSPIFPLLRTFINEPKLGELVRKVSFTGIDLWDGCYSTQSSAIFPTDQAIQKLKSIGFRNADQVIFTTESYTKDEYLQGRIYALRILLLSFCPKLTALQLSAAFGYERQRIASFLKTAILAPESIGLPTDAFCQLSEVEFPLDLEEYRWDGTHDPTGRALSLFYLPKIQRLSLPIAISDKILWPADLGPSFASELTSLSIHGLQERLLGQLLAPLHQLRSLKWQLSVPCSDGLTIKLPVLATSLKKVKDIEDVTILAHRGAYVPMGIMDELPPIRLHGSLNGLTTSMASLRRLQIPWVFVMGYTPGAKSLKLVLTRNLEQLTLTDDLGSEETFGWTSRSIISKLNNDVDEHHPHQTSPNLRQVLVTVFVSTTSRSDDYNDESSADDHSESEGMTQTQGVGPGYLVWARRQAERVKRRLAQLTVKTGITFMKLPSDGTQERASVWYDMRNAELFSNYDHEEYDDYFRGSESENSEY